MHRKKANFMLVYVSIGEHAKRSFTFYFQFGFYNAKKHIHMQFYDSGTLVND